MKTKEELDAWQMTGVFFCKSCGNNFAIINEHNHIPKLCPFCESREVSVLGENLFPLIVAKWQKNVNQNKKSSIAISQSDMFGRQKATQSTKPSEPLMPINSNGNNMVNSWMPKSITPKPEGYLIAYPFINSNRGSTCGVNEETAKDKREFLLQLIKENSSEPSHLVGF